VSVTVLLRLFGRLVRLGSVDDARQARCEHDDTQPDATDSRDAGDDEDDQQVGQAWPPCAKDRTGSGCESRTWQYGVMRVVEIRSYQLKPGTRDEYDRLFREEATALLRAFEIDVVGAGPSLDDPNAYFLIRAFDDLADRERREDRFYASPEWRKGPREAVVSRIESYIDVVIELEDETIEALRRALART
jgi:hypothetical protein